MLNYINAGNILHILEFESANITTLDDPLLPHLHFPGA